MKKCLIFSLLTALVLSLALTPAPVQAKSVFISIGGGPTGGTFNYFANGISLYVPKVYSDIKMSAEGSGGGGSVENVRRVNNGDFDFGISYAVDIGLGAVGKLPKDEKKYDKVRCLGYLYGAPAQLVVRADSPYKKRQGSERQKSGGGQRRFRRGHFGRALFPSFRHLGRIRTSISGLLGRGFSF